MTDDIDPLTGSQIVMNHAVHVAKRGAQFADDLDEFLKVIRSGRGLTIAQQLSVGEKVQEFVRLVSAHETLAATVVEAELRALPGLVEEAVARREAAVIDAAVERRMAAIRKKRSWWRFWLR